MFMPAGQLTFDDAVPLVNVVMVRKFERFGRLTRSVRAYIRLNAECVLGAYLAAGMIKTYGIITKRCCSADPALVEGCQVELPPAIWKAPKALDRIRLQLERGERAGEQPYLGGKVLPTMFHFDLYRCLKDFSWPLGENELKHLEMGATSHADRVASLIYIREPASPSKLALAVEGSNAAGQPETRTEAAVGAGQALASAEQRRGSGGAPLKYDWDAFWIEAAIWIEGNGFTEGARLDLQRHMQEWTATQWPTAPDTSTIRAKVKALFEQAVGKAVCAASN